jgi:tetratricopeptide (TPR) repeat protein
VALAGAEPARAAAPAAPAASAASAAAPGDEEDDEDNPASRADQGLAQAWLMLAQVAEQRGDFPAAERWLSRIDDPQRALQVQARRALLMARQGQVDEALASLRRVPERSPDDAKAKLLAEAQLLRDIKHWQQAFDAYAAVNQRFPDDTDVLYEQAMVAEKIDRLDELERLLRRVIELKPDHGHAHNALGYSLADRGQRLPEARTLIQRALELMPGDPFITDSLGWVEFRLGNHDEALRLLRAAWATRPDTEIGAHLGEVLWAAGQRDEARRIWRQALSRDSANEVLRETLARLQVSL